MVAENMEQMAATQDNVQPQVLPEKAAWEDEAAVVCLREESLRAFQDHEDHSFGEH